MYEASCTWSSSARSGGALSNSARTLSLDRKSTRLNSSHANISYAVFCLKKKTRRLAPRLVAVRDLDYGASASTTGSRCSRLVRTVNEDTCADTLDVLYKWIFIRGMECG